MDIEPHRVAKLSGIGCSSKTPDYFLGNSHGFNTVHGRMPSVLTGANLANRDLLYLGVSGDGDSASIGIGQFAHVMRRGVNMVYILENNGVYGLTKGQFSATADQGSKSKRGVFNNHPGSTKSYDYVREHNDAVNRIDFIPYKSEITIDYPAGEVVDVPQHDGSILRLRKIHPEYDPTDKNAAMNYILEHQARGEVVTGLLYAKPGSVDLHEHLNTSEVAFNKYTAGELCPGAAMLERLNASLR